MFIAASSIKQHGHEERRASARRSDVGTKERFQGRSALATSCGAAGRPIAVTSFECACGIRRVGGLAARRPVVLSVQPFPASHPAMRHWPYIETGMALAARG
jgi:hypothetical protein